MNHNFLWKQKLVTEGFQGFLGMKPNIILFPLKVKILQFVHGSHHIGISVKY